MVGLVIHMELAIERLSKFANWILLHFPENPNQTLHCLWMVNPFERSQRTFSLATIIPDVLKTHTQIAKKKKRNRHEVVSRLLLIALCLLGQCNFTKRSQFQNRFICINFAYDNQITRHKMVFFFSSVSHTISFICNRKINRNICYHWRVWIRCITE